MARIPLTWIGALLLGCAAAGPPAPVVDPDATEPLPQPAVTSLSTTSLRVGEPLSFEGSGFVDDDRGYTVITFRGRYISSDGTIDNVDLTIAPVILSPTSARWSQFGPYRVPFTRTGNELGHFEGRVFAANRPADATSDLVQATPLETTIEIEPSIVVRELQPEGAACAVVARAAINMLPYRLQVEAIGFSPVRFRYVISSGVVRDETGAEGSPEETMIEHETGGPIDALGEAERIRFAEVPYGLDTYRSSINIHSVDAAGGEHDLQVRLTVRRPLQVTFLAAVEPAEIYEPVPVSGCIPGGINGRQVNYSESHSETRERRLDIGWERDWETSYTEGRSENYTDGNSEQNRIGFSTTDGTNWNWNVNGEVSGELVVGVKSGIGHDSGGQQSRTGENEREWEESHSYEEAVEQSKGIREEEAESGTESFMVSSSDSTALEYSAFLLPNKYGLFYRQTTRLIRTGEVVAYDLCGDAIPVGDLQLDDFTWAPELAVAPDCPPFPVSSFPAAECLVSPCDGSR